MWICGTRFCCGRQGVGRRGFEFGVWGSVFGIRGLTFTVRCSPFAVRSSRALTCRLPKFLPLVPFVSFAPLWSIPRSGFGVWGSVFTKGCHLARFLNPVTPGLLSFCALCLFPFGVQISEFEVRRAFQVALNGASHHLTPTPNPIPTFESSVVNPFLAALPALILCHGEDKPRMPDQTFSEDRHELLHPGLWKSPW